jgi:hypothetical protein
MFKQFNLFSKISPNTSHINLSDTNQVRTLIPNTLLFILLSNKRSSSYGCPKAGKCYASLQRHIRPLSLKWRGWAPRGVVGREPGGFFPFLFFCFFFCIYCSFYLRFFYLFIFIFFLFFLFSFLFSFLFLFSIYISLFFCFIFSFFLFYFFYFSYFTFIPLFFLFIYFLLSTIFSISIFYILLFLIFSLH